MSQLVKICEACGTENSAANFFCSNCGADISSVSPSAKKEREEIAEVEVSVQTTPASVTLITCDSCGAQIPSKVFLCPECGAPVEQEETTSETALRLVIGGAEHVLSDGDVMGREGSVAADYFASIGTVSRRHAEVRRESGKWFLVPLSSANVTKLDGEVLSKGDRRELVGEHRVMMSTQCVVELRLS